MSYKYSVFKHPHGGTIHVFGEYRPYGHHKQLGGTASDWPTHSARTLDVKKILPKGLDYFAKPLAWLVGQEKPAAIAVVPSHDPASKRSGVSVLAERIAKSAGIADGTGFLARKVAIAKLATGGDRSLDVHLNSILAIDAGRFAGKKVLLVDDVMTTGNSIAACRQILLKAGAAEVVAAVFSQTTY